MLAGTVPAQTLDRGRAEAPLRGLPNAVASGDLTPTSAVLWARSPHPGLLLFQVSRRAAPRRPVAMRFLWITDPMQPGKVWIEGLEPATTYSYRAVSVPVPSPIRWAPGSPLSSSGRFRTPALPGDRAGLRFGASGDQRGDLAPYPSVSNAPDRDLHLFIELGDSVYADNRSPDLDSRARTLQEFRVKHQEVYAGRSGLNTLADLRASMSLLTVIDDHEVVNDFSGGAPPSTDPRFPSTTEAFINETRFFLDGLRAFHEYNPIRTELWGNTGDPRTAHKLRLYRARRYGDDAALFIMDARSFRDPPLPEVRDPFDATEVRSFLTASFDPSRTMLGRAQLTRLLDDLLRAEGDGVTWKFVMVPEPVQNIGTLGAPDRFEGYAAERTELLSFIHHQGIRNVVFVTADLHGTLINNLTYQEQYPGPQIPVDAFEVITGPVAYDAPLGPSIIRSLKRAGLLSDQDQAFYLDLPRDEKDALVQALIDVPIRLLGYDPLGLQGSSIDATLLQGGYTAAHVYGWTEFDIDAATRNLTVTTWGIEPYSEDDLADARVLQRTPEIVSRFVVRPK